MAMEFLKVSGQKVMADRDWQPDLPEPKGCCKDALMGFYDVVRSTFWPKKLFQNGKAPEVVRITNALGVAVASYSIKDYMHETGRTLQPPSS